MQTFDRLAGFVSSRRSGRRLVSALAMSLLLSPAACNPVGSSQNAELASNAEGGESGGLVYALPMTALRVEAKRDGQAVTYTVSTSIVADPSARYRFRYAPSAFADNSMDIQVNAAGLLSSDSATDVTDRTGDIVVRLARTAGALVGQLEMRNELRTPPAPRLARYPFEQTFFIRSQPGQLVLLDEVRLEIEFAPGQTAPRSTTRLSNGTELTACGYSLCYRVARPALLHFKRNNTIISTRLITIVDPDSLEGINLNTAPLARRTNTLTFVDGLPTRMRSNQNSTALAAVSLPLDAFTAFLGGITDGLTPRTSVARAQAAIIQAEAERLNAQRALIEAQRSLAETRAGTGGTR